MLFNLCLAIITITAPASPHYITLSIHFGEHVFPKTARPTSAGRPAGRTAEEAGNGRPTFDLALDVALADLMQKDKNVRREAPETEHIPPERVCSRPAMFGKDDGGPAATWRGGGGLNLRRPPSSPLTPERQRRLLADLGAAT